MSPAARAGRCNEKMGFTTGCCATQLTDAGQLKVLPFDDWKEVQSRIARAGTP